MYETQGDITAAEKKRDSKSSFRDTRIETKKEKSFKRYRADSWELQAARGKPCQLLVWD